MIYANIYDGVDLQYVVSPNNLKENLILANKNTQKTFTAEYKINGLTAAAADDRTIEFRKENGEAVYTLSAPYMSDANGEICTDITIQIVSQKNGKVTIQTVLNEQWLADEERQFPVVIDPVITTGRQWGDTTNCQDAYIASGMPNACYGRGGNSYEGSLYVGKTNGRGMTRALLQVPNLPDIGVGSKVIDARVSFCVRACYPEILMEMYRVTSPWQSNTVCWNSGVTTDWQILDYQVVPTTIESDPNVERWQTFEITDLVRGWYSGEYPNYGVCLLSGSEWSSSQARAWIYSNGFPGNQTIRPLIQISYRNMSGYEDYWTYTHLPAGRDGVASVNNFNGNLVYSQPLFTDDNTLLMPVNISLIYNQNKGGAEHGFIGNHFQTNYHVSVAYDASTAPLGYQYYLNDADGTKHWFYFENGSNEGRNEDGLSYKMTVNESISSDDRNGYKFTITDKAKNKMYFNGLGLLKCVEDANGNKALVSYNDQNRIHTITNGSGQVYTFSYDLEWDRSKITSLTNPAGTTITFEYDGSNSLTRVYFPDKILHLWPDGNGKLYQIDLDFENSVKIQYDASPQQRVTCINVQTLQGEVLDRYWFDYRQNATNVTDNSGRLFTYQFNDYGQTTGIVSGESGEVQTYQYEPGNTTSAKANKITSMSRAFSSTENLIVNPMINRALSSSYDVYYTDDVVGNCYAVRNADFGHSDNGCIKIHKDSISGSIFAYQEVLATPGIYTLSCYVTTNGAEISGLGALIELDSWNNGAFEKCAISERVKLNDSWERISATLTITETRTLRSLFSLDSYAADTVYFDDIQLEKSAGETSFNLVENSAFRNGLSQWKTGGDWPTLGFNPNSSTLNCTDCARFAGGIGDNRRNLYQTINISGKANDTFSFGAWVYAQSVPIENGTKENDPYQPMFEINVGYYDMDGIYRGTSSIKANADLCHAWQFVSGKIHIPIDYSELEIVCWYSHNANDCFFTNAFCYKEPYDSTLKYDSNGNVVFDTDVKSATCKYNYEENNIAKITTPTGSRMFYTYDDAKLTNLTYSLSSDGTQSHYNYDSKGNLTQTTLKSRKPAATLEDGKTYFIVNAFSGQLIDSGTNPQTIPVMTYRFDENSIYQQWKLEAVPGQENVYRLKSMAYGNCYLGVEQNSAQQGLGCYAIQDSLQTFKILQEQENTYSIFTGTSNYEKCLDAQYDAGEAIIRLLCVRQATYYPEVENMRWYFYPVECDDENTITTSTAYTENGAYPVSSTDSLGNTTTYSYDQTKHVLDSATNAGGVETSYTYEEDTNRLKTVSCNGVTIHYAYNNNRLVSDINANDSVKYNLVYDNAGRLSQTKVGNGTDFITLSTNEYTANSLLKKQTYGNGAYFENSYDRLDRLAGITYNGNTTGIRYLYNSSGQLFSVQDETVGRYVKNSYDSLGRIQKTATYPTPEMRKSMLSSASYRYEDITGRLTGYTYKTLKTADDYQSLDFGIVYGSNTENERIKKLTLNGQDSLGYTYDAFGRLEKLSYLGISSSSPLFSRYAYVTDTENHKTSSLIQSLTNPVLGELSYAYDALGNITEIRKNGELLASYTYDDLNQLSSVTSGGVTKSYVYSNGNIVSLSVNGEITKSYGYTDPTWADLLTSYNGQTITYDAIGNPLQYRDGLTMTWQNGRQLASLTKAGLSASYTYGLDGIRTAKTVNGTTTEYYWQNGILQGQRTGNDSLLFLYNAGGAAYGFFCKIGATEALYYYLFNAQGDVIGLLDSAGNCVAEYEYDEWGKLLSVTGSHADTIGQLNPLRYRSYYYDSETGFYYLQSRYYDPEIGRFINADGVLGANGDLLSFNLFAYCGNNPVNRADPTGKSFILALIVGAIAVGSTLLLNGCSSQKPEPYSTPDAAAKAFSEQIYNSSLYIRHEYATEIYSRTINGKTTYNYNPPRAGNPHSVAVGKSTPKGTTIVAYAHTHPNSNTFSGIAPGSTSGDIIVANNLEINAYVVGPNLKLQRYDFSSKAITDLGSISPVSLSDAQKASLVTQFQISWDTHIADGCDFNCGNMSWPTP